MRRVQSFFPLVFILVIGSLNATADDSFRHVVARPDYQRTISAAAELSKSLMSKHNIPGVSLAVVDDQRLVWAGGFGYADRARQQAADEHSLFRAGTLSTLLTSLAVMQLVERGAVDLDKPVSTYIDDFSIRSRFTQAAEVTPRHIMAHHSGLPSFIMRGKWSVAPSPVCSITELLKTQYLLSPPGYVFSLSDPAFTLLGCLAEQASGEKFEDYMQRHVLQPLGMRDSSFVLTDRLRAGLAKEYKHEKPQRFYHLRDVAAGGLYTNVMDISRFMRMLFAGGRLEGQTLLRADSVKQMWSPQNRDTPMAMGSHFGMGWALSAFDLDYAGPVAHYGGESLYHHSHIVVLPAHRLGVIVMANAIEAREAVATIARQTLVAALEDKTGIREPQPEAIRYYAPGEVPRPLVEHFSGRYATWQGLVNVYREHGHMKIDIGGRTLFLLAREDGRFKMEYRLFGWIPIHVPRLEQILLSPARVDSRDIMVANYKGWDFPYGEKIQAKAVPESWRRRLGRYHVVDQDQVYRLEDVRLSIDQGVLLLTYRIPDVIENPVPTPLEALSDQQAVVLGLGSGLGATVEVIPHGQGERLRIMDLELQRKDE